MGYSVKIARLYNQEGEEQTSDITLEEWLDYIVTDTELERPLESDLTDNNREYYQQKPGYCEWTYHSKYIEPFARPWFDYYNGEIFSENTDDETLLKMIAIAERLNASVQGQDGELYTEDDAMKVKSENDTILNTGLSRNKKPWWRFW